MSPGELGVQGSIRGSLEELGVLKSIRGSPGELGVLGSIQGSPGDVEVQATQGVGEGHWLVGVKWKFVFCVLQLFLVQDCSRNLWFP